MSGPGLLPVMYGLRTPQITFGSNLVWWLQAGVGTVSGTNNPVLDGDSVSGWADKSGAGDPLRNLVQATANNQPLYVAKDTHLNNRPSVNFDYTGAHGWHMSTTSAWSTSYAQPWAIFVAGWRDPSVTVGGNQYFYSNASGLARADQFGNTLNSGEQSIIGQTHELDTTSIIQNTFVTGAIWNSTSSQVFWNSKTALVTGNADTANLGGVAKTVGTFQLADIAGNLRGCHLAEIVACNVLPSATQISQLFDYFHSLYGCPVTA